VYVTEEQINMKSAIICMLGGTEIMEDWNLNTAFIAFVHPPPQTDTVLYMAICMSIPSSPQ
jgi:hypothetical protein